jgi:hypothetical protein
MFEVCNSVHLVHGETDVNPVCMLKLIEISCMLYTKKKSSTSKKTV